MVERKHMQGCCCKGCELGDDDFNRADENPVTGSWYEISGNWAISGNKLIDNGSSGKLATTICHPVLYDKGAWKATFDLVECRTKSTFVVGAGDPGSSPYRVTFAFANMDTGTAKITITIDGDETVSEEYPWPGGYSSDDTVPVYVCYEPGAKLSAVVLDVGKTGIYACTADVGSNCFTVSYNLVGGFFFVQGSFDNWVYEVNRLDNSECVDCGCTCWKAYYPDDKYEPLDYGCFPENLKAIFTLVTTPVSGLDCTVDDFEVDLPQFDYTRTLWKSGPVFCEEGKQLTLLARCVVYEDAETGLYWNTLRLEFSIVDGNGLWFFWTDLNTAMGDTTSVKMPDFELSTCSPLSLVYKSAIPQITPASGYPPTSFIVACCGEFVGSTPPLVKYHVTVVPA